MIKSPTLDAVNEMARHCAAELATLRDAIGTVAHRLE